MGGDAQAWQEQEAQPRPCDAPILYVSADGTGVPMVPEELKGRRGKQTDGTAKTRQVYMGCVFTQHRTDDEDHPVRDYESTTYVSSCQSMDAFGPLLRQEALRCGPGKHGPTLLQRLPPNRGLLSRLGARRSGAGGIDWQKPSGLQKKQLRRWAKRLLKDKVQALIQVTRQQCAGQSLAAVVESLGLLCPQCESDAV